ncbi:MAG: septation protein IspZ [Roseiarcus sp.]|jgi:intracellular septation protein A
MKMLLQSAKFLLLDMASTFFFLGLYLLTRNVTLAVVIAIAIGLAQIGWEIARRQPIEAMQWMSLFLVVAAGVATLLTKDPRFVLIKPSVIYVIVGVVMLKPGWMNRYLPPVAIAIVPDVAVVFGFIWAGLMFATAAVNLVTALALTPAGWALFMGVFTVSSKVALFLISFAAMRVIGRRRRRAIEALAARAPVGA